MTSTCAQCKHSHIELSMTFCHAHPPQLTHVLLKTDPEKGPYVFPYSHFAPTHATAYCNEFKRDWIAAFKRLVVKALRIEPKATPVVAAAPVADKEAG